jgi:hypothetical protein
MAGEAPEISDAEKREMRSGLARGVGALMRAWWLGMFQARDDAEQKLLDEISAEVASPERAGRRRRFHPAWRPKAIRSEPGG